MRYLFGRLVTLALIAVGGVVAPAVLIPATVSASEACPDGGQKAVASNIVGTNGYSFAGAGLDRLDKFTLRTKEFVEGSGVWSQTIRVNAADGFKIVSMTEDYEHPIVETAYTVFDPARNHLSLIYQIPDDEFDPPGPDEAGPAGPDDVALVEFTVCVINA